VVSYVYACETCGPWEIRRPIGTAQPVSSCPECGAPGRRRYTAPLLAHTPGPVTAARLREEASGSEPAVTTAVPRAAGRPARRDPRWSALPRP
jgi:putative FmdB family regulatory protein